MEIDVGLTALSVCTKSDRNKRSRSMDVPGGEVGPFGSANNCRTGSCSDFNSYITPVPFPIFVEVHLYNTPEHRQVVLRLGARRFLVLRNLRAARFANTPPSFRPYHTVAHASRAQSRDGTRCLHVAHHHCDRLLDLVGDSLECLCHRLRPTIPLLLEETPAGNMRNDIR